MAYQTPLYAFRRSVLTVGIGLRCVAWASLQSTSQASKSALGMTVVHQVKHYEITALCKPQAYVTNAAPAQDGRLREADGTCSESTRTRLGGAWRSVQYPSVLDPPAPSNSTTTFTARPGSSSSSSSRSSSSSSSRGAAVRRKSSGLQAQPGAHAVNTQRQGRRPAASKRAARGLQGDSVQTGKARHTAAAAAA